MLEIGLYFFAVGADEKIDVFPAVFVCKKVDPSVVDGRQGNVDPICRRHDDRIFRGLPVAAGHHRKGQPEDEHIFKNRLFRRDSHVKQH